MEEVRYLKVGDKDFIRLLEQFLNDNAIAYLLNGEVYFGIRKDLDEPYVDKFDASLVILTTKFTCNCKIEQNIVKMMSILKS
jgi:hypothetical protein